MLGCKSRMACGTWTKLCFSITVVVDFWSGIVGPLGVLWYTSAITRDLHRFAGPQGVDKQKGQQQVSASLAA